MPKITHKTVPINDSLTSRSLKTTGDHPLQNSGVIHHLTTEELAESLGMSAQTLRKRYSQTGSYFSVRPIKLPNRRLLWPGDSVEQLISSRI